MSHLNSYGDLVAGQTRRPWTRMIADGQIAFIHPFRATQLYWETDSTIVGNFQTARDSPRWRPARLTIGGLTEIADQEIRVIRAGGGVWAFDDGNQVVTSWGRVFPNMAVCEVSDDGVVYIVRLDGTGFNWCRPDGRTGIIDTDIVSRAAEDTRSRGGVVSWQDSAGLRVSPKSLPYVERIETPVVAIPLGHNLQVERTLTRITCRNTSSPMGFVIATGDELHALDAVLVSPGRLIVCYFTLPGQLPEHLVFRDIDIASQTFIDLNKEIIVPTEPILQAILAEIQRLRDELITRTSSLETGIDDIAGDYQRLLDEVRLERPIELRIFGSTVRGTLK